MRFADFRSELPDFAGLLVLIVCLWVLWCFATPAFVGGFQ